MSTAGSSDPRYSFREEATFVAAKDRLRIDPKEVDEHLWAIQDALLADVLEWSYGFAGQELVRVAFSEPTPNSPIPLRVLFRIEGETVALLTIGRR